MEKWCAGLRFFVEKWCAGLQFFVDKWLILLDAVEKRGGSMRVSARWGCGRGSEKESLERTGVPNVLPVTLRATLPLVRRTLRRMEYPEDLNLSPFHPVG